VRIYSSWTTVHRTALASLVEGKIDAHPGQVFLLSRKGKDGLGTAYIAGFRWGLARDYAYFFEMDADFSHNPKDLNRLLKACKNGQMDVGIGSRYVTGGRVVNWPFDRLMLSYAASLYVRIITWMPIKDPTAGFICYRREVLESIDLDKIKFVGYAFQIEMKYAANSLGFRLQEVPITFADREQGTSKMHKNIIAEAILGVLQMRWYSLFNSYRA
jgi:dolichol-phosphate mannosyltransferase